MQHSNLRAQIRAELRAARRALTAEQQHRAATDVSAHLLQQPYIQSANRVAVYLSNDGELNLMPFIEQLWALSKQVVVPVISSQQQGQMWFVPFHAQSKMVPNKYGIAEPTFTASDIIALTDIDVICTPLVAFDSSGQRIGMGGGFYDRILEPWFKGQLPHLQPVGVAHNCQQLDSLPAAHWDIPLPVIITPSKLWQFSIPNV